MGDEWWRVVPPNMDVAVEVGPLCRTICLMCGPFESC